MAVDYNALTLLLLRWIHFVAGVLWIGLLYYFNVVQVPAFKTLDGPVRSQNIQRLVPRALFYFRWGAFVTVLAGILLMYMMWPNMQNNDTWVYNVSFGATLGLLMFINVWGVIWPNQKKIIQANVDATAKQQPVDPATAQWAKSALYASRANLLMSFPMLFFMASASHSVFDWRFNAMLGLAILVLGALWLYVWTHMKHSPAPAPAPGAGTPRP